MNITMTFGIIGGVVLIAILMVFAFSLKDKNGDDIKTKSEGNQITTDSSLVKVSSADFKKRVDQNDSVIIDFRTVQEVNAGTIGKPVNIDFYSPTFQDELAKLDRNSKYLIYCNSGNRSGTAMTMMKNLGFKDVTELQGGITAWKQSGFEINQ